MQNSGVPNLLYSFDSYRSLAKSIMAESTLQDGQNPEIFLIGTCTFGALKIIRKYTGEL